MACGERYDRSVIARALVPWSLLIVGLAACSGTDGPPPTTAQPSAPGYPPPGYYPPPAQPGYYPQQPPGPSPKTASVATPAPSPSSDRFASARQQCVTLTNNYRARVGVPPVTRRPENESCADAEAASDSRSGQAHGAFGLCRSAGAQNECPGWDASSPDKSLTDCLASMFGEGPGEPYAKHGHYLNMTNTRFSGVACGFATSSTGSLWIVQDFF